MKTSHLSLTIENGYFSNFITTKAKITESLDDIFNIECDGYCSSLTDPLFNDEIHSYSFLNKSAILSIKKLMVDKNSINLNKNQSKTYKGIVSKIEFLGTTDEKNSSLDKKYFFKFSISSFLYRLSLNKANRVFNKKTILEVIKHILYLNSSVTIKEYDFSNIKGLYHPVESIVQYEESDLEFLQRICFNSAIYFYEDEDKVYFYDENTLLGSESLYLGNKEIDKEIKDIEFNSNLNNPFSKECISSITKKQSLKTNSFTLSSQTPSFPLSNSNIIKSIKNDIFNELNHLDNASFTDDKRLYFLAQLKALRSNLELNVYKANSNYFDISLNEAFSTLNQNFKVIALTQTFIDESILENTLNSNENIPLKDKSFLSSYSNELTIIPLIVPFIPKLPNKPKTPSSLLGVVIGKNSDIDSEKNTIYTDEFGRVRVRINSFYMQELFDRQKALNSSDDSAKNSIGFNDEFNNTAILDDINYSYTPYLRVSYPIASSSSGFFAIPRVGDEVIISFLKDDIDSMIVVGNLYNLYNPALPKLPQNHHQTTLSSKTIGKDESGKNELTLSNLKDKEQIYLKAQKDYDEIINHNFTQKILNNKDSITDGNYTQRVKKAHFQTIDLAKNVVVGAEYLTTVGASRDTIVGISNTLNVGLNNKLRVAKDSSEYIGANKSVEIDGNLESEIKQDELRVVKGNKKEIVDGSSDIKTKREFNLSSEAQINFNSTDNILYEANRSISFNSNEAISFKSQRADLLSNSLFSAEAKTEIINSVKNSLISIKDDKIILRAGGVEVIIDSSGLTVIGGEIKGE